MEQATNNMKYPIGLNVFAYVKKRNSDVKIHIRHFATSTKTKGGRVLPTQKGVTIDFKSLNRLFKIKKHLKQEFNERVKELSSQSKTDIKRKDKTKPKCHCKRETLNQLTPIRQVRTDLIPSSCIDVSHTVAISDSPENVESTASTVPLECV